FEIALTIAPAAGALPAGPLYSVLLNGIRNGVEAIARSAPDERGRRPGRIDIAASIRPPRRGDDGAIDVAVIDIRDDGRGLPGGDPDRAFELGFSTKPGSLGVGLALSREVVRELGGSIELIRRSDRSSPMRPGMVLRIHYH